jgi:DNA-binding CsgD family transcriptional regulator
MLDPLATPGPVVSPREAQVLDLLVLGLSNQEIASRLDVTVHAVKFHLAGVYRKLGSANRTETVVRWLSLRAASDPVPEAAEGG